MRSAGSSRKTAFISTASKFQFCTFHASSREGGEVAERCDFIIALPVAGRHLR